MVQLEFILNGFVLLVVFSFGEKMLKRYLIHKTIDWETGKPGKEYYTQNPIPEGAEFEVQYEGQTLQFRVCMHYVSNEVTSVVELVGVDEPCAVKRPRVGG